jgi:teichuronic acid biosynthesis glycosyltransferase TuaG
MSNKITIITPTYNSSKFIKRTIDSVLEQTYTDWEFLLIDDHSTDNTVEIINEFVKNDPRIKLLSTPQNSGGPALPKNVGIENATGEYVAFLDHDDEWLPKKLEKQLEIFNRSANKKLGIVACYLNIKNTFDNKIISKYHSIYIDNSLINMLQYNYLNTSSCVMTKLSILKEVGPFDINFKVSDDWDMWLRILRLNYKLDYVPEYLTNYNRHENNLSSNRETELQDFKLLLSKNNTEPNKLKESIILSYYYYNIGQYNLSRKYCLQSIFSKDISLLIKLKSVAYLIFTFFPSLKEVVKRMYNSINEFFIKNK